MSTDGDDVASLVTAAAGGDRDAWNELVRRFSNLIWSIARAHGLGDADAKDVVQVTWLRFTEHIDRIREPERAGGWLATTARHESLRVLRNARRTRPVEDVEEFAGPDPDDTPEMVVLDADRVARSGATAKQLWLAMAELRELCQRLLRVLMADPPPSYASVSAALDMPIGSIGPTRARCYDRLRAVLARHGITGPVEDS